MCSLRLSPEIIRCRPHVMRSLCTKFDGPSFNDSVCIVFTRFYYNDLCVTLTSDPWNWKAISAVLLSKEMCVPSLTVLTETVQSVSCLQGLTTIFSFLLWHLTPTWKINRCRPLVIRSMLPSSDRPSWNNSVCFMFTSFVDRPTDRQTPAPYHNTSRQVGCIIKKN